MSLHGSMDQVLIHILRATARHTSRSGGSSNEQVQPDQSRISPWPALPPSLSISEVVDARLRQETDYGWVKVNILQMPEIVEQSGRYWLGRIRLDEHRIKTNQKYNQ